MATLYYGDNLDIRRRYIEKETVDLVYLDPPPAPKAFGVHSAQNYNAFFHEKDGTDAGHPNIAGHLLTASVLSAPAALLISKVMLPETEKSETAA